MTTLFRNAANQKLPVFAYDKTTGEPKTGDAANITAQISKDWSAAAATNDTNPTELDSTDHPGIYLFDLTAAETAADVICVSARSSTGGVLIDPVIAYTQPKLFTMGTCTGTPTTTSIPSDVSEATADHFNNGFILFISGALAGQKAKVTDYDGAGTFTVQTLTDAPAAGDEFVIIGGVPA
jgi:hypothetical protein